MPGPERIGVLFSDSLFLGVKYRIVALGAGCYSPVDVFVRKHLDPLINDNGNHVRVDLQLKLAESSYTRREAEILSMQQERKVDMPTFQGGGGGG